MNTARGTGEGREPVSEELNAAGQALLDEAIFGVTWRQDARAYMTERILEVQREARQAATREALSVETEALLTILRLAESMDPSAPLLSNYRQEIENVARAALTEQASEPGEDR